MISTVVFFEIGLANRRDARGKIMIRIIPFYSVGIIPCFLSLVIIQFIHTATYGIPKANSSDLVGAVTPYNKDSMVVNILTENGTPTAKSLNTYPGSLISQPFYNGTKTN